jgi:hypothetical protein
MKYRKILQKSIKKAYDLWQPNKRLRCNHFAFAFHRNKMIEFAANDPINKNLKAYKIGQHFNVRTFYSYPYLHSESHLISKLLHRYNSIRTDWSIVVLRINREGRILGSKPCKNCQKILDALELYNVFYSTNEDTFTNNDDEIFYSGLTSSTVLV